MNVSVRSGLRVCRPLALSLALLASEALAQANAPSLRVELRDTGSQRVLHGAQCALVRPGARGSYARFEAPDYKGPQSIRENDELIVYRRGHDTARVRLAAGVRSVSVALSPASRPCVIVLQGAGAEDPRFQLVWTISSGLGFRDQYRTEGRGHRVGATISRGVTTDVTIEGRGVVAWPRRARVPEDGAPVRLRLEPPWMPKLRTDVVDRELGATEVEFFPDFRFVPPGPPERVDAWRMAAHRPWWGRSLPLRDGCPVLLAPPVPVHVVATLGGRTLVRHVAPGSEVIDLRGAAAPRPLRAPPLLDGRPAPPGTVVLPGRLDVATVAAFLDVRHTHPGLVVRIADDGTVPGDAALPPADWLTAWHPAFGLAHVRWIAGEQPSGRRYPGSMVVHAPRGWALEGTIAGYPIWRGTGTIRTIPPDLHLKRDCAGAASLRFRGLRPGWHAFDLHLELVHEGSGRRHRVDYTYEVELTAEQPHRRFDLRDPSKADSEARRGEGEETR